MLFTSSFKLLSVLSASLLPALLVSASPHSLSERADFSVAFFQCDLGYSADCLPSETSETLWLDSVKNENTIFDVVGGWGGKSATAESTTSLREAQGWKDTNKATLAWGTDGQDSPTYYVIFDNDYSSSSDGSDDTIKGR